MFEVLKEMKGAARQATATIALSLLLVGCSTDRFRLANREDTGYERFVARNEQLRVPRAPGAAGGYEGPPAFAGVAAPVEPYAPAVPDRLPISTDPREQFSATLPAQPGYPPSTPIPGMAGPMPPNTYPGAISAVGTELAGRVVAPTGQPAPRVPIQVFDAANTNTLVAEVATDGEGVFRIRNLQPGARYRLNAASQSSEGRLSGFVNTVAPDPSVVLQLQLDNMYSGLSPLGNRLGTGGVIPSNAVPPSPTYQAAPATAGNVTVATVRPIQDSTPVSMGRVLPPSPSVEPLLANENSRSAPNPQLEPEKPTEFSGARENLPLEFPKEDLSLPDDADASSRGPSASTINRSVPSDRATSAFAGTDLEHARVYDLDGQPKPMGAVTGNLIVIDFFGTWCGPCRRAVPHLNEIASRYAERGVQIVGIACERGDMAAALESAATSPTELGTRYPIVVSPLEEQSPVRDYFHVRAYPTVILIDRAGKVHFQATGGDAATFRRLDTAIQEALQTVSIARVD